MPRATAIFLIVVFIRFSNLTVDVTTAFLKCESEFSITSQLPTPKCTQINIQYVLVTKH